MNHMDNVNQFGYIFMRKILSKSQIFDIVWWNSSFSQTWDFTLLRDSRPDTFTFTSIDSTELNTEYTSNQITITWIHTGSQISIAGWTYQLDNTWSFISTTWIAYSWTTVKVKLASSSSYSSQVMATLNVGEIYWNFTVTTKSAWGGGGGGWGGGGGGWSSILTCSNTDLICSSWKYILKPGISCEWGKINQSCSSTITWSTWATTTPIYTITTKVATTDPSFSVETNNAYLYAYDIGITTMPTIQQANMNWLLTRAQMAKMMVNYAVKVLDQKPNTSKKCVFNDTNSESMEFKWYITYACQMWLMGVGNTKFNPNDEVTRAEFGTVLSRVLFGTAFDGGHLIIKSIWMNWKH